MFKTIIAAAAFAITAATAQAAVPEAFDTDTSSLAAPAVAEQQDAFETAYYCEWITVYDYWGNWVTVWQCY